MHRFKWAKQAKALAKGVPGTPMDFRYGTERFFTTWFESRDGKKTRALIFRVNPNRQYLDRFHWWMCQEYEQAKIPKTYRLVAIESSRVKEIDRWIRTHHWTFMQKGFPIAKRWLKRLRKGLYAEQKAWLAEQPDRDHCYEYNFETGQVKGLR